MHHTREEVIARTVQEFELLDGIMANLTNDNWATRLIRPETKDPWTVKDALAHITHWKADVARSAKKVRRPKEEQGLGIDEGNHLVYLRWRDRTPQEVLAWHRQVHQEVLSTLQQAPDEWYTAKDRNAQWPYDLDGHSAYHRLKDITRALEVKSNKSSTK